MIHRTFDPHLHPRKIVLVGCGGTGSHIARLLARLLVHMQGLHMQVPALCVIDPDRVEFKNVGRQLYTPSECGMYKAEATARRLSCALGLSIEWVNAPFNAQSHVASDGFGTILVDAVDNHLARRELAKVKSGVLVSCGNHRSGGQVAIGTSHDRNEVMRHLSDVQHKNLNNYRTLPSAYLLFPALLEPEDKGADSSADAATCADWMLSGEQDLFVNDLIAMVAARYIAMLLLRQPISSFLTFCDLDLLVMRPIPLTPNNLLSYLKST